MKYLSHEQMTRIFGLAEAAGIDVSLCHGAGRIPCIKWRGDQIRTLEDVERVLGKKGLKKVLGF